MRDSDLGIVSAIVKRLGAYGIETSFVLPTATAMAKSIMDATDPLRVFLKQKGIHDYAAQGQGREHKRLVRAEFVTPNDLLPTTVSLYRPATKDGDPRIWFYGLQSYATDYDLLAVIVVNGNLYIVNTGNTEILNSIDDPSSPLGRIASYSSRTLSSTAEELLYKLGEISKMGYVPTVRNGDTGVGATLEHLLGIRTNSSKAPDYKGIELKAGRHNSLKKRAKNRVNLFSQVPDWKKSPIGSAIQMLRGYGYVQEGRMQLYCTLEALKANSQKLVLSVDSDAQHLKAVFKGEGSDIDVMVWSLAKLTDRLTEKHPESFWIKADSKTINGIEHFHYYKAIHTARPMVANLPLLLADGIVTLDLTMSQKGANSVRDHGYLFKIWPDDFVALFPLPREYDLRAGAKDGRQSL
jgi:hypothetical protein